MPLARDRSAARISRSFLLKSTRLPSSIGRPVPFSSQALNIRWLNTNKYTLEHVQ
jgi:hypothetical protein